MKVVKAKYVNDYILEITFDDGKVNKVDFLPAIKKYPGCDEFLDVTKFKKFKLEMGNVVWGKNWDMIFHVENLYKNNLIKRTRQAA